MLMCASTLKACVCETRARCSSHPRPKAGSGPEPGTPSYSPDSRWPPVPETSVPPPVQFGLWERAATGLFSGGSMTGATPPKSSDIDAEKGCWTQTQSGVAAPMAAGSVPGQTRRECRVSRSEAAASISRPAGAEPPFNLQADRQSSSGLIHQVQRA